MISFNLTDLSFFHGKKQILKNIDLALESGKFYGLIGPNGCGKTTLLDLISGSVPCSLGRIDLHGQPINKYSKAELAKKIALVPQEFTMGFDFSVFEVVLMGRHPHIPRFARPSAADLNQVEEALTAMDIDKLRNRPVTRLSGGEKQRVVVARALAQDSDILILDEATSNLDIHHTIEIMRVIKRSVVKMKKTVIAAIHDLNLAAAYCDELIILKDGRVTAMGAVNDTLTTDNISRVFQVDAEIIRQDNQSPRIQFSLN